jgi:triphosphoribosyl-dephospho-CoA synthase
MSGVWAPAVVDIACAAQLACLLEVNAPKPGNVSPGRNFDDLRYEDFLASAAAIGRAFAEVGDRPLGAIIHQAVQATLAWTRSNSNLGIILLLAPVARAASAPASTGLRGAVRSVLESTTVDDAREVYAAIRAAAPGGLGRADAEDVAGEPTRTLYEVMQLAADRDGIAREYATGFEVTFEIGAPALTRARGEGLSWPDAVVETYLKVLAECRDTHIARRAGANAADEVSRAARAVLTAGGVRSGAGREALDAMDRQLRTADHLRNPGTTADLTAAAIFVVLLEGGWFIQGGSNAKSG